MSRYGRRLHRSPSNRFIGGVCGGIAEHFSMDPSVVRILGFLAFCFTGLGFIVLYIGLLILLPSDTIEKQSNPFVEQVRYSHQGRMQGLDDLSKEYDEISNRLIRLENVVSSRDYDLKRELDRL